MGEAELRDLGTDDVADGREDGREGRGADRVQGWEIDDGLGADEE